LEGIDEDIKSIKNLSPSERERLNQKLKRLERETANLRQIVKQQKLVLINFVSTFVLIALATLLGLTLFGLFLVRVISTPVEVFSKAMKKLSAGDFSAKVNPESFPIKQVKELKEFAADYNRTVDRLKELYDNLEREKFLFETVFDKVSTGVALFHTASGELIKANRGYKTAIGITDLKTLREWVKDKDYYRYEEREITPLTMVFVEDLTPFVINKRYRAWKEIAERLAHDIKNPLNAIQLQIELLERIWEKNPERFEETFKTVKKDITKQIDYISGLIDAFNNLSSQDVEIKKEFFSLRQLLFEVKKVFEDDRFKVFVEIPPLWIRGDRAALKRVFENLVKNAREVIEKTKGSGFVRIRAEGNKIHVIDDGPGIPPDKVDKIFLPFVSTKGKGRGLGLFNVKRIVEEHGWNISVVPPRKGEGAHFVIEVDPRDVRNKLPRSG
jgi:two-component system nitrogen regulation sensor histidine kinase NtrY